MKFSISKNVLSKALQCVQGVTNTKTNLPILSNILIEAKEESVALTTTDLDMGMITTIQIKPTITGSITIPAKKFFDIIKELPEETISIVVKKNNLTQIECEKNVFKVMGLPRDEFPQLPEFKNKEHITITQKKLKTMLSLTSFAVSSDETRYVLNGILFLIQPDYMKLVATDGRRLAVVENKAQFPKTLEKKFIVPTKTINELSRVLGEEGEVEIFFSDNQVLFDTGATKLVSRLIEGEFPNYEQVIPKDAKDKLMVPRDIFLSAVKRAALFTSADSMAVRIDLSRDKVVISKNTPYLGEARVEVDVDYKGKDFSIGFNPNYLIDLLKNIDQEKIGFELVDSEKPGVVRVGDEYVYVVLPMQIT